jgi:hypothetical protein
MKWWHFILGGAAMVFVGVLMRKKELGNAERARKGKALKAEERKLEPEREEEPAA